MYFLCRHGLLKCLEGFSYFGTVVFTMIYIALKGCALRVGQKRIEHSLTFQIMIGFGRS